MFGNRGLQIIDRSWIAKLDIWDDMGRMELRYRMPHILDFRSKNCRINNANAQKNNRSNFA